MCVFATIDLQGFANHLELANLDLRTEIGNIALRRLDTLKNAMHVLVRERAEFEEFYPLLAQRRINDMLMLTIDLPNQFLPDVGATSVGAFTNERLEQLLPDFQSINSEVEFRLQYNEAVSKILPNLFRFVGLIARIHGFIASREKEEHWPGVKTVVSIGTRRCTKNETHEDDPFSLNLAFTNCYIASGKLSGPGMFLDGQIAHYLCSDFKAQCILWNGLHVCRAEPFNPKRLPREINAFHEPTEWVLSEAVEVEVLRKKRHFFLTNKSLCFLHFIDAIYSDKYKNTLIDAYKKQIGKIASTNGLVFNSYLLVWVDLGQSIKSILGQIASSSTKKEEGPNGTA